MPTALPRNLGPLQLELLYEAWLQTSKKKKDWWTVLSYRHSERAGHALARYGYIEMRLMEGELFKTYEVRITDDGILRLMHPADLIEGA